MWTPRGVGHDHETVRQFFDIVERRYPPTTTEKIGDRTGGNTQAAETWFDPPTRHAVRRLLTATPELLVTAYQRRFMMPRWTALSAAGAKRISGVVSQGVRLSGR
jgi:hypothetical protein